MGISEVSIESVNVLSLQEATNKEVFINLKYNRASEAAVGFFNKEQFKIWLIGICLLILQSDSNVDSINLPYEQYR